MPEDILEETYEPSPSNEEITEEIADPTDEITVPEIESIAYIPLEIPIDDEPAGTIAGEDAAPVLTHEPLESDSYTPFITIETPSDTPGETTLDDDGDGTLGLIIDRYTGILSRGLGSLFECQRVYVYLERLESLHTVNRNSFEHSLIVESGGSNVGWRRGNDSLVVDAEWIVRQNPELIIRTVNTSILGPGIASTTQAENIRAELLARPGFENINAVINRRILLLSDALLQSEEGRLIAKLHIAHAMYPTLFTDVNIQEIYLQIRDSGGADYTNGIFVL